MRYYIGEYYRGYWGDTRSLDYGSCRTEAYGLWGCLRGSGVWGLGSGIFCFTRNL